MAEISSYIQSATKLSHRRLARRVIDMGRMSPNDKGEGILGTPDTKESLHWEGEVPDCIETLIIMHSGLVSSTANSLTRVAGDVKGSNRSVPLKAK